MSVPLEECGPRSCRWIDGAVNGSQTLYCGCRTKAGTSWCPTHFTRAYRKRDPKAVSSYVKIIKYVRRG